MCTLEEAKKAVIEDFSMYDEWLDKYEYLIELGKNLEPYPEEEKTEEKPLVHKPEVEYDDFAKLEFRVGEIIACEEVPKSRKLLCNTVRFGNETRQILSGIKAWYKPEEMVGKKVMAIVNLKPAKLAGMMSEGMILKFGAMLIWKEKRSNTITVKGI